MPDLASYVVTFNRCSGLLLKGDVVEEMDMPLYHVFVVTDCLR